MKFDARARVSWHSLVVHFCSGFNAPRLCCMAKATKGPLNSIQVSGQPEETQTIRKTGMFAPD
eukprot:3170029-Lingulodinium_polyedra.AAC.1